MTCPAASPVKQLRTGYPTAHVDCGVASTEMALRHALCDAIDPTPPELRERGNMGDGPTSGAGWKRAVDSYAPEAAAMGRTAPVLYRLGRIDQAAVLGYLAQRNAALIVSVRYAVLQAPEWQPYRSSVYTGLHAMFARGLRRPWGAGWRRVRPRQLPFVLARPALLARCQVEVLDPLADGRYRPVPGDHHTPTAPQWWPWPLLWSAGEAIRHDNRMGVCLIYRTRRLEP